MLTPDTGISIGLIIAGLGALVTLIAVCVKAIFFAGKLTQKLDSILKLLEEIKTQQTAHELRLQNVENRVTKLEQRCEDSHCKK